MDELKETPTIPEQEKQNLIEEASKVAKLPQIAGKRELDTPGTPAYIEAKNEGFEISKREDPISIKNPEIIQKEKEQQQMKRAKEEKEYANKVIDEAKVKSKELHKDRVRDEPIPTPTQTNQIKD